MFEQKPWDLSMHNPNVQQQQHFSAGRRSNASDVPLNASMPRSESLRDDDAPRIVRFWKSIVGLKSLDTIPSHTRDQIAFWVTYIALGIGLTSYVSVLISQVIHSYQNPYVTNSFVHDKFPIPGMFVCGHCLDRNSPESCGEPSCLLSTAVDPDMYGDPVEHCDDYISSPLTAEDRQYKAYPQFVQDYIGFEEDGNCMLLRPPRDRHYRESDRPEKLFLRIKYPDDKLKAQRERDTRPHPLVFGVFDAKWGGYDLPSEHTQVDTGYVHVKLEREHLEKVTGEHKYTFGVDHHGVRDDDDSYLTFEVQPSTFLLLDEVENARFTWSQLLGNASAALGLARMIAQFLLGRSALSPWGWIHRWVTKTSPSSLGRKAGLDVPNDLNPLMTHQRRRTKRAENLESRAPSPALSEALPLNYQSSPLIGGTPQCHSPRQFPSCGRQSLEDGQECPPGLTMPAPRLPGATAHHHLGEQGPTHSPLAPQVLHSMGNSPGQTFRNDSQRRFPSVPPHVDRREPTLLRGSPPPYTTSGAPGPSSSTQGQSHPTPHQGSLLLQGRSATQGSISSTFGSSTHTVEFQFLMRRVAALECTLAKYYTADLETAIDVEMIDAAGRQSLSRR